MRWRIYKISSKLLKTDMTPENARKKRCVECIQKNNRMKMSNECIHASCKTFNSFRRPKKPFEMKRCRQPRTFERYQIDNNVIRMMRQYIFEPNARWNQISQKQLFWSASRIFVRRVARRCLKCCESNWKVGEDFLKPSISIPIQHNLSNRSE